MAKVNIGKVRAFDEAKPPLEVEDEILRIYATLSMEHDMTVTDCTSFFESLELPRDLWHLVRKEAVVVAGTDIVDLDKLIKCTYRLLIVMDNAETVDTLWKELVASSGRASRFPAVELRSHVLGNNELANAIEGAGGSAVLQEVDEMMATAVEHTGRRYMTYLDFACLLGKLGYLRY